MIRRAAPLFLALILGIAGLTPPAEGQGVEYVRAHYTKYDHRIAMRDGVKLFTSVYVPKDLTAPAPIVLQRTPYSVAPYGIDQYEDNLGPSPAFARAGYIVAYQDVRGCYLSEGEFEDVRPMVPHDGKPTTIDESTDTYDTIDWLVKNIPGNNGRVGTWGISYPGFYAAASLVDAHPALKAASPQAPLVDWFLGDDTHHNGALFLQQEFNFDAVFGLPRPGPTTESNPRFDHGTPDAYDFFLKLGPLSRANDLYFHGKHRFWDEVMRHDTYDAFWQARALLPHLKDVKPAVLTVGGWFDAEDLYGPLHTHQTIQATSPGTPSTLVMGPWVHGGWAGGDGASLGAVQFGAKTAEFFRDQIQFPFFEHHLREVAAPEPPRAWIFTTGRNEWSRHDAWPPKAAQPRTLFLHPGGKLAFEPPPDAGFDEFRSDPAHPVPYSNKVGIRTPNTYMVEDQRFAARRPDVLVYQTDPLAADVTLAGPIRASLQVATTGTDADWVVKLIDVYPDDLPNPDPNPTGEALGGYQQLVRGDVMRGKFRRSFEKPEPFKPGALAEVPFVLQDVAHTFRAGHRIMVQVQSSWFPLVDRNPQTFTPINAAKAGDFQPATHRVYRSADRPSKLDVLVMP